MLCNRWKYQRYGHEQKTKTAFAQSHYWWSYIEARSKFGSGSALQNAWGCLAKNMAVGYRIGAFEGSWGSVCSWRLLSKIYGKTCIPDKTIFGLAVWWRITVYERKNWTYDILGVVDSYKNQFKSIWLFSWATTFHQANSKGIPQKMRQTQLFINRINIPLWKISACWPVLIHKKLLHQSCCSYHLNIDSIINS